MDTVASLLNVYMYIVHIKVIVVDIVEKCLSDMVIAHFD